MTSNTSIDALRRSVASYWSKSGINQNIPIETIPIGDGTPYVEAHGNGFDIVISERGTEFERFSGLSLIEATRWFIHKKSWSYCCNIDAEERRLKSSQDEKRASYSRWNWMAPTIFLMAKIDIDFGNWARDYYQATLKECPLTPEELSCTRFELELQLPQA